MTTLLLTLFLETLLWLLIVALHSLRLAPSGVSEFELMRRVKAGDDDAKFQLRRDAVLPDIHAVRFVLETLLVITLIATVLANFSWWLAVPLLVVALMYVEGATRWKFICENAAKYYARHELSIVAFVEKWQHILKWLRAPEGRVPGQFVYSREELLERLKTTHGVLSRDELNLLQHSLDFGDKLVYDIMTPRSVIDGIKDDETLGPVALDRLHNSGHSRFPVYEGDIDHVVGMLYLRDLVPLKKDLKYARDAMKKDVYYVREDQDLEHALAAFLKTHHHLFIVVNQYRETVGILSLEDVLETLIGHKIIDEFDQHHDLRAVAERNPRGNNLPKQRKDV